MSTVLLRGVTKAFGAVRVLEAVDLEVPSGRLVSLLGPSGCGKTTLLRMVAGLEDPDTGCIAIGDRVVADAEQGTWVPPERRRAGMVFQSYAVWPHMDVLANVAYPLRVAGRSRAEREAQALSMIERVGLGGLERRRPHALSGGQQQRVALARGLIMEPEVLLLDEPLSNLDAHLRRRMRDDIRALQQDAGVTVLYVTHDREEALAISDAVVVLDEGRVLVRGTPAEVADHPFLRDGR